MISFSFLETEVTWISRLKMLIQQWEFELAGIWS